MPVPGRARGTPSALAIANGLSNRTSGFSRMRDVALSAQVVALGESS